MSEADRPRYVHPTTGEVVEVVYEMPDLLGLRATWPPGPRTHAHAHPGMQERWEVLAGRITVDVDGVVHELGPGQDAVADPGQRHRAWNSGEEQAVVRIEMRPALRWHEFVRRLFSGEPPRQLLAEFTDEIALG